MSNLAKKHHLASELCLTRAKYRQGREFKAVKVYTINQESSYLLIQGVPALGTEQDLQKLLSEYGTLIQTTVLHEYPAEEFTEVYLVQYQRIQSARIAKKKMDNLSFFGGILHICYAPEYESVDDTREKLQDRRKAVAKRCRQIALEKHDNTVDSQKSSEHESQSSTSTLASPISAAATDLESTHMGEPHPDRTSKEMEFPNTTSTAQPSESDSRQSSYHIPMALPPPLHMTPWAIPPPPPPDFDHARVPSSHATLPPWLQNNTNIAPNRNMPRHAMPPKPSKSLGSPLERKNVSKTHDSPKNVIPNKSVLHDSKLDSTVNKPQPDKSKELIIRPHHTTNVKPKFVPRQVFKKYVALPNKRTKITDAVNEKLRKDAFILKNEQGPTLPPEEEKKRQSFIDSETGSESLDTTVTDIRMKVKQLSTPQPASRPKKQKTS